MRMPRPLCTRLPATLESDLEEVFLAQDWRPSEGLRVIVQEWLAAQRFPQLEFRDTRAGRRAALREGPEVWEIAAAAGPNRAMSAAVGQQFAGIRGEALEEALRYAREFSDEIDRIIAREKRFRGD